MFDTPTPYFYQLYCIRKSYTVPIPSHPKTGASFRLRPPAFALKVGDPLLDRWKRTPNSCRGQRHPHHFRTILLGLRMGAAPVRNYVSMQPFRRCKISRAKQSIESTSKLPARFTKAHTNTDTTATIPTFLYHRKWKSLAPRLSGHAD